MSLEAILAAIQADGAAELADLEASTAVQIQAVQQEAEQSAQQRYDRAFQLAHEPAAAETKRIIEQARSEARQITAVADEAILTDLVAQVAEHLRQMRQAPGYHRVWARLAREAVRALGDDETAGATLEVDPRDVDLADPFARRGLQIRPVLDCMGGVVLRSRDGRIVVDNRLEARLERALPAARLEVAALING